MKTTKNGWNKETIQDLLERNDRAVERALLQIYWRQTATEQVMEATVVSNGIGFTSLDSRLLSSFAQFYEQRGFLTGSQVTLTRVRIRKYWRQLLSCIPPNIPSNPTEKTCTKEQYLRASQGH